MNQPTAITVTEYTGREVNPHRKPKYIDQVPYIQSYSNKLWLKFERSVKSYLCPSIANTEPGGTVLAYQVIQERNPKATNAFDWQDCVVDGYDPICKTGWEQRIIWRPVDEKSIIKINGYSNDVEKAAMEYSFKGKENQHETEQAFIAGANWMQSKSPIVEQKEGEGKFGEWVSVEELIDQFEYETSYTKHDIIKIIKSLPSPPITEK